MKNTETTKDSVISTMHGIHGKHLSSVHQDFLPSKNNLPIYETEKYFYKQWDNISEFRLWKKSGICSMKTI